MLLRTLRVGNARKLKVYGLLAALLVQSQVAQAVCVSGMYSITLPQGAATLDVSWFARRGVVEGDAVWDSSGHKQFSYSLSNGSYEFTVEGGGTNFFHRGGTIVGKTQHIPEPGKPLGTYPTIPAPDGGDNRYDVSALTAAGPLTVTATVTECPVVENITFGGGTGTADVFTDPSIGIIGYTYKGAVEADPPYIPTTKPVDGKCVVYETLAKAVVSEVDHHQSGNGVPVELISDRNTTTPIPDVFKTPKGTTGSTALATYGTLLDTHKQGTARISFKSAQVLDSRITPLTLTLLEADYQSRFQITHYITALESDFTAGATVTNPPGLTGTFNSDFLYSGRGVLMEGYGQSSSGSIVTIDWRHSPQPLRPSTLVWTTDSCARGNDQQCLVINSSIAVDKNYIPLQANVDITGVGPRHAHDSGDRIQGYHIDVYEGFGRAAMAGKPNISAAKVRYLQGGGQCH